MTLGQKVERASGPVRRAVNEVVNALETVKAEADAPLKNAQGRAADFERKARELAEVNTKLQSELMALRNQGFSGQRQFNIAVFAAPVGKDKVQQRVLNAYWDKDTLVIDLEGAALPTTALAQEREIQRLKAELTNLREQVRRLIV